MVDMDVNIDRRRRGYDRVLVSRSDPRRESHTRHNHFSRAWAFFTICDKRFVTLNIYLYNLDFLDFSIAFYVLLVFFLELSSISCPTFNPVNGLKKTD